MIPDERLSDVASALSIDPLFRVKKLEVHVAVKGNQSSFVLHAPLHLHNDRLVYQVNEKRLGVYGNGL